jgi:glutaconate CoA-transferase subunit B
VLTVHNKRRFVEKVDFLTSPGYLTGPGAREEAGLPARSGPYKIITNLAVLGFDEETRRMRVESLHPGVTLEHVIENTGFALIIPDSIRETEEPTADRLRILREEVDPNSYIIGR